MKFKVFNPNNISTDELPTIYGFNNGGYKQSYTGILLAEDGTELGQHLCSDESFMLEDLGIIDGWQNDRHEVFKKHYPQGYKMDFVSHEYAKTHEGLQHAIKKSYESREHIKDEN